MIKYLTLMVLLLAVFGVGFFGFWVLLTMAFEAYGRGETVRPVISKALTRMDGGHLELKAVEVSYAPGGSCTAPSHPCPVIACDDAGEIRRQVDNEPDVIYEKGKPGVCSASEGRRNDSGRAVDARGGAE